MMDGAVVADEAGPVHAEDDRLAVQNDFLPDLVVGTLGEGGIDRREGAQARLAHAGGHARQVALADAGIEVSIGIDFLEFAQAGAIGHGGRQGDDARILAWPGRSWRRQRRSSTTFRCPC